MPAARRYDSGMRLVRRHDLQPRVELLPLIDVIFLLLTFFIYSLVMMVQAQVLPVQLVGISTGEAAEPGQVQAITIDRFGGLYFNREPVAAAELDAKLTALAEQDAPPKLFLAMEQGAGATEAGDAAAPVDRGPLLLDLVERLRRAGLTDFTFVGAPAGERSTAEPASAAPNVKP